MNERMNKLAASLRAGQTIYVVVCEVRDFPMRYRVKPGRVLSDKAPGPVIGVRADAFPRWWLAARLRPWYGIDAVKTRRAAERLRRLRQATEDRIWLNEQQWLNEWAG